MCNEHQSLMKGCKEGSRKPQECGYRICNQKYMFIGNGDEGKIKYCTLSRKGGGGATAAITSKCLIVGIWGADVVMSND